MAKGADQMPEPSAAEVFRLREVEAEHTAKEMEHS